MSEEVILYCDYCGSSVETCDGCYREFQEGDQISCYNEGGSHKHFCGAACMLEYLFDYTVNSEVKKDIEEE